MDCCDKKQRDLPGIDCTAPHTHRPGAFGEPETITDDSKHRIIVWQIGEPLRGLRWTFVEVFDDNYDAIVSAEWMEEFYRPGELHKQVLLEALARRIGLIDGTDGESQDEDRPSGL